MDKRNPDGPSSAQLIIHQSDQADRTIPLHGDGYRIGRDGPLEVSIDHPAVSRQHALLHRQGRRQWILQDLDSTNGLWWKGRRVSQLELRDGDVVQFAPALDEKAPFLQFNDAAGRRRHRVERWLGLLLFGCLGAGGALLLLSNLTMPIRGQLARVRGPVAIYDGNNQPLTSVDSSRHRELKSVNGFSPLLVDALLSSEDNRFWWHPGVDPIGTLRAFSTNLIGGKVLEGGSSLTQQLARSLYPNYVGDGDTLERKWKELLVSLQLESRFSKSQLLLSYLNRVYLGVGWGFEDASRVFFDQSAADLNVQQAALLVGLLPSPNGHDPCQFPQRALKARNRVINKMADGGRLSLEQARLARRQPIQLAKEACSREQVSRSAPFYTDQVRRDLTALVGPDVADEGNFLIETHLDPVLQSVLERQLSGLLANNSRLGVQEGAAVVLDSRTGGVLAIAGGRDYNASQFNRASMALRQPGSTFKLITYLAALEQGLKPNDTLDCSPLRWGGQRFDSTCSGQLTLASAFASSHNTAALRLAQRVGLEQVVSLAKRLGITTPLDPVPGLALGQSEVRLIELTSAYAAVANGGIWQAPTTIRRLLDAETCRLDRPSGCGSLNGDGEAGQRQTSRRVLKAQTTQQMQGLMRAVIRSGTGRAASLGGQEGGKTGTTNDGRDLLFIGYEPSRHWVLGIWLGNDDNSPSASSSVLAASLWSRIMRAAGQGGVVGR
ncbi:transglycosylase domain-containing protein [Synechococcus sp. MVIR-18-1]|uniref:transglycosylase domain-containing protein n=1 Tax=Synechococcus sp. MVIR-18-1 TaxID=1386941 RepID=UPI001644B07C|nr:transglycosylase domain-containing protein [Synechococcus sp. MVIR-18-1]QNI76643.1 penicillin-binding-like protein PBP2 [Synechococcus sp. MVIR-18-1]